MNSSWLTEKEEAEMVERINANPYLQPNQEAGAELPIVNREERILQAGQNFLYGLDHKFGCNSERYLDEAVERVDILAFARVVLEASYYAELAEALEHLASSIEAENERGIGVSGILMSDMREARALLAKLEGGEGK
jgi:hypothetical protein